MLVPKHVFAIAAAAAKEKGRYAINGVLLRRNSNGNPVACATDGRIMVAATWREDDASEFPDVGPIKTQHDPGWDAIFPLKGWADLEKKLPKLPKRTVRPNLNNAVIEEDRERSRSAKTATTDLEQTHLSEIVLEEGQFPKYEQVIPKVSQQTHTLFAVNPDYLARVAKAVADCAGASKEDGSRVVYLAIPKDSNKPMVVSAHSPNGRALGVCTGVTLNVEDTNFTVPGNEKPPKPEDKAVNAAEATISSPTSKDTPDPEKATQDATAQEPGGDEADLQPVNVASYKAGSWSEAARLAEIGSRTQVPNEVQAEREQRIAAARKELEARAGKQADACEELEALQRRAAELERKLKGA